MDSVFVYFANAGYEQIEAAAAPLGFCNGVVTCEADQFYFRRYSREEQLAELEEQEAKAIKSLLGSTPESAFEVACRNGSSASFALEVVSKLMQQFQASALDDDFGHFLSSSLVAALHAEGPERGVYAVRELPKESP